MGRIGRVVSWVFERLRLMPAAGPVVRVEGADGDVRDVELYHLPGVVSGATSDDAAVVIPIRRGYGVAVATRNYQISIDPDAGGVTLYSTNAAGDTIQARVDLTPDGFVAISNTSQDWKTILDALVDELIAFRTTGSPTNHTTDPGTVANLNAIKANVAQLFVEAE